MGVRVPPPALSEALPERSRSRPPQHHLKLNHEALALWADSGQFCGAAWFAPFGFTQGLVDPATGEAPDDLLGAELALVGTVDTVIRQLERLLARLPVRRLFAWTYNSLIPHDRLMRSIELFASTILPRVADLDTGAGT